MKNWSKPTQFRDELRWSVKGKTRSLLKFRAILIVLTLPNPNVTTKLPFDPPTIGRGGQIKKKLRLLWESNILVSNYNIYWQIMSYVFTFGTLNTKKNPFKRSLRLRLPRISASWCLPYVTPNRILILYVPCVVFRFFVPSLIQHLMHYPWHTKWRCLTNIPTRFGARRTISTVNFSTRQIVSNFCPTVCCTNAVCTDSTRFINLHDGRLDDWSLKLRSHNIILGTEMT